ncbi:MAG: AAA family ATPase [Candidatus Peribacteraceae bacterium]|nr:AAA family ATPase [Candidatus Peribacteraceae bacterium]
MKLHDEQQEAFDFIMEFIDKDRGPITYGYENMCVLGGYAGTGKSTTIQELVFALSESGHKVCITAPTNKAVKVLIKMAREWGLEGISTITIYSLLGLVLKQERDKEVIRQDGENKIHKYDVVVVDEGSMVNSELMKYLKAATISNPGLTVLFVGDPGQIPPVNEEESLVFKKNIRHQFFLKTIRRQAEHNPVINNSLAVRKVMDEIDGGGKYSAPLFNPQENEHGGFHLVDKGDLGKYLQASFTPEWYPEQVRFICWTNKVMDSINQMAHKLVMGKTPYKFTEGETVCFRSVVVNSDNRVIVPLETEGRVNFIKQTRHVEYNFPCYEMDITTEDDKDVSIYSLIPGNSDKFYDILGGLANQAKAAKPRDRREKWGEFWDLKTSIINIKHTYAITAHRSQGSTFENVLVLGSDIIKNHKEKEMIRLMYVSLTRPSSQAVLFV